MIYLAPLQGFTDFVYRNAYAKLFKGVDKFFTPYISLKNKQLAKKYLKEVFPENNKNLDVVPQVLVESKDELRILSDLLRDYGYSEINLNLGCPYPMVTRRGKGAGLLPYPDKIYKLISCFLDSYDLKLSVKLRLGLEKPDEIERVISVLNRFDLEEVIVHPRVAKQLYKGKVNLEVMDFVYENLHQKLVYNGDICSVADVYRLQKRYTNICDWMIGRGVLMNPFLPEEINGRQFSADQKHNMLKEFHKLIFTDYQLRMDNEGNVLKKMQEFWIYFSYCFPEQRKAFKAMKKSRNIQQYKANTERIFSQL